MLTEARDIADELGDVELRTEAMNWRVCALVAVVRPRRRRGARSTSVRATAERTAQPFHLHVAEHSGSAIALCEGRLADAEAMAVRSHEWSRLLTGRDASGVYGIQMFSVRREQGRLAELAPADPAAGRRAEPTARGDRASRRCSPSSGMEAEARRELARVAADGLDEFRASLWLASLTLPHRRVRGARRRGDGRAALPGARAATQAAT